MIPARAGGGVTVPVTVTPAGPSGGVVMTLSQVAAITVTVTVTPGSS